MQFMQLFQDEKIKHRIIGLAVLMSVALVFVPAMVKKSNQRLDRSMNLSLNLPPKPTFPKVAAVKPQELFKTVKVAQVVIPEVVDNKKTVTAARAESLSGQTMATRSIIQKTPVMHSAVVIAKADKPVQRTAVSSHVVITNKSKNIPKPVQRVAAPIKPAIVANATKHRNANARLLVSAQPTTVVKSSLKTNVFSVQVASFARQDNALYLVHSLQKKGFKASYDIQGSQYRVLVGQLGQRNDAKYLQQKLASSAQLTGFIVKIG